MSVFHRLTNGHSNGHLVNGYSIGTPSSLLNGLSKQVNGFTNPEHGSTLPPVEVNSETQDPIVTRETVSKTFAEYAQFMHTSQRPLPTQSGDGLHLEHDEPSGFWGDMKSLGIKGTNLFGHKDVLLTLSIRSQDCPTYAGG